MPRLTEGQLDDISKRIDELIHAQELCTDKDQDVLANIESELGQYIVILKQSIKACRIHESGFKLIKGGKND